MAKSYTELNEYIKKGTVPGGGTNLELDGALLADTHFAEYQRKVAKLGTFFDPVKEEVVDRGHQEIERLAERIKETKKFLGKATDSQKEGIKTRLEKWQDQLEALVEKHGYKAERMLDLNDEAIEAMERGSEKLIKKLDEAHKGMTKGLEAAYKKGAKDWEGHKLDGATSAAREAQYYDILKQLDERYMETTKAISEDVVIARTKGHQAALKDYNRMATKLKRDTGLELISSGSSSTAETLATDLGKAGETVAKEAKGASGFAKVISSGLGGIIGYIIGHQFDSEDSQFAGLVGAGAGTAGGYALSTKLFRAAAHGAHLG